MKHTRSLSPSLLLVLLFGVMSACAGDDTDSRVCEPGRTLECACPGGTTGAQTCNVDGSAWSACDCGSTCTPDCSGRVCGADPMCGMSCGTCSENETCSSEGQCESSCTPDCTDRVCGVDPMCGMSCGTCSGSDTCNAEGQCESSCTPDCTGRVCGLDPVCGMSCGSCGVDDTCTPTGQCMSMCVPDCSGRVCGADPLCGTSCGTCPGSATCTDEGQCTPEPLTILGWTSLSTATITVEVGGTAVTTTANQGQFRATIDVSNPDAVVSLYATGADSRHVLASVVGPVDGLVARAGADRELTVDEHNNARITVWSTARYAALFAAGDGTLPDTGDALWTLEQDLDLHLGSYEIMETAAILQLIIESPGYDLPPNTATTRAFVEDRGGLYAYIQALRGDDFETGALPDAIAALSQETTLWGRYDPARLERSYVGLVRQRNGYIGTGGPRWDFDNQTGRFQDWPRNRLPTFRTFSWETPPDGRVVLTMTGALQTEGSLLSTDELVATIADPTLASQARALLDPEGQYVIMREWVGREMVLVTESPVHDHVLSWDRWRIRYDQFFEPLGLTVPVQEVINRVGSSLFRRASQLQTEPFTPALVTGTWVMPLAWPSDLPYIIPNDPPQPGESLFTHTFVNFDPLGTGSATGGVLTSTPTFVWSIDADGSLVINRTDGSQDTVWWVTQAGPEYGFLTHHRTPSGEVYSHYWRAIRTDRSLTFSAASMIHPVGQYWRSTINVGIYLPEPDGSWPIETLFGFRFDASGTLGRVNTARDLMPPIEIGEWWDHVIEPGRIQIRWRWNEVRVPRCDAADPRCIEYRNRTWQPVAQQGNLLYVYEQETFARDYLIFNSGAAEWDPVLQAYVDGDDPGRRPLDLTSRSYFIFPRLNAYYIDNLPN